MSGPLNVVGAKENLSIAYMHRQTNFIASQAFAVNEL